MLCHPEEVQILPIHPSSMKQSHLRDVALPPGLLALGTDVLDEAFRVHRVAGPGYVERVYQRFLAHALQTRGLHVEEEVWFPVTFDDLVIERAFRADIVVNHRLLVEVKAVDALHPVHVAQAVSYLKASGFDLGYVISFNVPMLREGIRRVVHPRLLL